MEQNKDNNQIFLLHGAMVVVATTAALGGGWLPNFGAPKRVEPSDKPKMNVTKGSTFLTVLCFTGEAMSRFIAWMMKSMLS